MADWLNRLIRQFVPEGTPLDVAFREWYRESGYWYTASALVHAIGFVVLAIVVSALSGCPGVLNLGDSEATEAITLDSANVDQDSASVEHFNIGQAPLEPTRIGPETLLDGPPAGQTAMYIDDSSTFVEPGEGSPSEKQGLQIGGDNGINVIPNLPGPAGTKGLGATSGAGTKFGVGDSGNGIGGRGKGSREALLGTGGTPASDRAVIGGLNWLARHQAPAGNWSLQYGKYCKGGHPCSGEGSIISDAGATAMAILAYQAFGLTHMVKKSEKRSSDNDSVDYRHQLQKAIFWLIKHQNPQTGDLSAGCPQPMYAHGLATIALCEAFAMTGDPKVGAAATKAVRLIERAQNEALGGWRYHPRPMDADTSVTGWQVMALKSAEMAGIGVNSMCYEGSRKWLASVAKGEHHGLYVYQPYKEVEPAMTAVGMLCQEYLGVAPDDPALLEGKRYLLENLPDANLQRDIYYWYYATLAMHNFLDADFDRWNRPMRKTLITTQCKEGCAEGSWDPANPTMDRWSSAGRVYETAFSTLTLEVYYRFLPLFKVRQSPPSSSPNKAGSTKGPPAIPAAAKPGR